MSNPASNPPAPNSKSALSGAREQVGKTHTLGLWFSRFAGKAAYLVGHPSMFLSAALIVIVWAAVGPYFHYADTWQLVINTGSSIVTFLVVFLIQNTQNRDAKALHLKLDELIRSHHSANNDLIDIEKLSDEELDQMANRYAAIHKEREARKTVRPEKLSA